MDPGHNSFNIYDDVNISDAAKPKANYRIAAQPAEVSIRGMAAPTRQVVAFDYFHTITQIADEICHRIFPFPTGRRETDDILLAFVEKLVSAGHRMHLTCLDQKQDGRGSYYTFVCDRRDMVFY
jgi:hypothetical protein